MNNLVSLSTYARRIGERQATLQRYQDVRADFPEPALVIDEYPRIKRLWERSTLDSYFAKIESERLVKQEFAHIRATRKRANAELYKYCRFLGGITDAASIRKLILTEHHNNPIVACEMLDIDY